MNNNIAHKLKEFSVVGRDKRYPGLATYKMFKIIYNSADKPLKKRFDEIIEKTQQIDEKVIRKAYNVARETDLNNFSYRYLGYEEDEEVRNTISNSIGIRINAVNNFMKIQSWSEIKMEVEKLEINLTQNRTAKADLQNIVAKVFMLVVKFETLKQHFARLQEEGKLSKSEPLFAEKIDQMVNNPEKFISVLEATHGSSINIDPW